MRPKALHTPYSPPEVVVHTLMPVHSALDWEAKSTACLAMTRAGWALISLKPTSDPSDIAGQLLPGLADPSQHRTRDSISIYFQCLPTISQPFPSPHQIDFGTSGYPLLFPCQAFPGSEDYLLSPAPPPASLCDPRVKFTLSSPQLGTWPRAWG